MADLRRRAEKAVRRRRARDRRRQRAKYWQDEEFREAKNADLPTALRRRPRVQGAGEGPRPGELRPEKGKEQ